MIISCPSCQASFRVDAARLGPDGKKVRCSKCGDIWHASPDTAPEPRLAATDEAVSAGPAPPTGGRTASQARDERPEPRLTARGADEEDLEPGASEGQPSEDEESDAGDEVAGDGLTGEQRARLAAARQKNQPRGPRFLIKILLIFIIVAGLLVLAQRMGMVPSPGPEKAGPAVEQPAKEAPPPAPAESESNQVGGHIVGGPLPETEKPEQ